MKKFWKGWRKGSALADSQPDPHNAIASTATGTIAFPEVTYTNTTIHEAARQGNDALVKSLLRKHTSAKTKSPDLRTPLSLAAEWGRTSTVKLLLKWGAKVYEQDGDGRTPLHWAAEYGHADVVRVLMKKGALANVRSDRGDTPASLARACDQHEVLRLMSIPGSPPAERVRRSATQTLGARRMTDLEEQWLAARYHDPFA